MKLLVTGREGQLVRSLMEAAPRYTGIELTTAGRPQLDLAVPGSAAAAIRSIRPDLVVNAAAYTAVDRAEGEEALATRINGDGAGEVAEAARAIGAPVIQLSTDYVFDGRAAQPYSEDAAPAPLNVYGRIKLLGEEAVRASNPRHLILRTSWVYSPFGSNFVRTMLRLAGLRQEVEVVSDQRGSPTSALHLADALLRLADEHFERLRDEPGRTLHLSSTGACSWAEFANEIYRVSAGFGGPAAKVIPVTTAQFGAAADRPRDAVLDSSRFAALFGFGLPAWPVGLAPVVRRLLP